MTAGGASVRSSETGSAAVYAVLLLVLVSAAAGLTVAAGAALAVRHRAGAAADLAALATADHALEGAAACRHAAAIAAANGARLVRCAISGEVADVLVEVRLPQRLGLPAVHARARARPTRPAVVDGRKATVRREPDGGFANSRR
jgi:secretion/DNA translocation related TadE-like protein